MNDENKDMNFEQNDDVANDVTEQSAIDANDHEEQMGEAQTTEETYEQDGEPKIVVATKRGVGKKVLKLLIALISFLVVFSLVASAAYTAVANYVLFPDFDDALSNSLENKFDLGTEFDFASLKDAGKIELAMYPSEEEAKDSDIDKVIASISYNGLAEMSAKLTVGDQIANAYLNEDAIAANLEEFNSGEYYGISFEDLADRLEGSFFDPDEESKHVQLTETQFEELEEMVETFLELRENEKEYQKDMAVLLNTAEKAFKTALFRSVNSPTEASRCSVRNALRDASVTISILMTSQTSSRIWQMNLTIPRQNSRKQSKISLTTIPLLSRRSLTAMTVTIS
jgi:hypothetical protein